MTRIDAGDASAYEQLGLRREAPAVANDALGQSEFLKLMTTQLRNQDPFAPMDNTQFLGQIAQFGTVSGIDRLNQGFDSLSSALTGNRALQASMIVGSQVLVPSPTQEFDPARELRGAVELATAAGGVQVVIEDPSGRLLARIPLGDQGPGLANFAWDGIRDDGQRHGGGVVTLRAEGAVAGEGRSLPVLSLANVDSVTLGRGSGEFTLHLAGVGDVTLDQVRQITR